MQVLRQQTKIKVSYYYDLGACFGPKKSFMVLVCFGKSLPRDVSGLEEDGLLVPCTTTELPLLTVTVLFDLLYDSKKSERDDVLLVSSLPLSLEVWEYT